MTQQLRIVVADDEPDMLEYYQHALSALGHEVVGTAANGRELVDKCVTLKPDLAITDVRMPGMDGIEAADEIYRRVSLPVLLVSAYHDHALINRAENDHILAYLVKPIKQADLEPAIVLAVRRFEQFEALRKEAADLRQALVDRKIIERAKGILMEKAGLNEQNAFRRLQRLAREQNRKLVEIAQMIITAEEAFVMTNEENGS